MVAEDLHAWLCVWVVGRLEAEFGYAWKGRTQQLIASEGKQNKKNHTYHCQRRENSSVFQCNCCTNKHEFHHLCQCSQLPPPATKPIIMSRFRFTEFGEELVKDAHEISESEAVVGNHALDLMELGQMGGIQGFVSEHPVDGEVLDWRELLLRKEVKIRWSS